MKTTDKLWLCAGAWAITILTCVSLQCCQDDGVMYDEVTTVTWDEIGALDPRYTDPQGPGIHVGQLNEPGCHGI